MSAMCLTGWQQPPDALRDAAPVDALHFDYGAYGDLASCFRAMAALPSPDMIIGWSLGARIAMVGVAHGIVKPKQLLLISSKYQCIRDDDFSYGITPTVMEETQQFYFTQPEAMLQQFQLLIAKGDSDEKRLMRTLLARPPKLWPNGFFWLEQLERISARDMDFSDFPPTHLLHGDRDVISPPEHSEQLQRAIPGSTLELWHGCAHAPHLHDAGRLQAAIERLMP